MKNIYIVLYDVYDQPRIDAAFENVEDAEAYIRNRDFPDDYGLIDWVDYYESGAKEKFGW